MRRLSCGCIPDASGFGYCGECTRQLRAKVWSKMSEKEKNYDRHFDTHGSRALDEEIPEDAILDSGCSCHINPPCSYCTSQPTGEE